MRSSIRENLARGGRISTVIYGVHWCFLSEGAYRCKRGAADNAREGHADAFGTRQPLSQYEFLLVATPAYPRCASTNRRYLSTPREISVKMSAVSLSPSSSA